MRKQTVYAAEKFESCSRATTGTAATCLLLLPDNVFYETGNETRTETEPEKTTLTMLAEKKPFKIAESQ